MKKFIEEFKAFAMRGNVIDMAVGVVIGGAFGKITLLRNNAGMFINQRLKPEYEAETGEQIGWSEFSAMAEGHAGSIPLFDINAARFTNPPLTTIHAPAHWMGLYGASLLYHVLSRHEDPQPIKAILPCKLVERASCQKAD